MTMRFFRIATIGLLFAVGCAHSKTTDEGAQTAPAASESDEKPAKPAKPRAEGGAHESARVPSAERNGVPLATAPGGLLAPGAEDKIREKLVAEGCLADGAKRSDAMKEGIRRCQTAHDLPATGVADHATVKALGLDPDQIFRQGPVKD
jgi:hypothetical protein